MALEFREMSWTGKIHIFEVVDKTPPLPRPLCGARTDRGVTFPIVVEDVEKNRSVKNV